MLWKEKPLDNGGKSGTLTGSNAMFGRNCPGPNPCGVLEGTMNEPMFKKAVWHWYAIGGAALLVILFFTLGVRFIDNDKDGQSEFEGDCNDRDIDTFAGARERCDGVDNDCDGVVPEDETDQDGDGYPACNGDCNDQDRSVAPDKPEICDGVDNDCDGELREDEVDFDKDGQFLCQDDVDDLRILAAIQQRLEQENRRLEEEAQEITKAPEEAP